MKAQVDVPREITTVGALSLWERAGVRVTFDGHSHFVNYPQSLLADLWITCSPIPEPHANQALQTPDQKTTSLTRGFF